MKRNVRMQIAMMALFAVVVPSSVLGAIIHESATLGPTGTPSEFPGAAYFLVDGPQYVGSRFSVDHVVSVEAVGGHLYAFGGQGQLFAAIIPLSGPTALPSWIPYIDPVPALATALFTPPNPSNDILAPLSVTLNPGHYALLFGSYQFGATGYGTMPDNNIDIPGSASYFYWDAFHEPEVTGWRDFTGGGLRFVVTGRVIPEPGAWELAAVVMVFLVAATRRRLRLAWAF